jgi:ATP-dependent Lhr-like helicase
MTPGEQRVSEWFSQFGWKPFPFQRATWKAYLEGQSGLVHAPTGSGKTLAILLGPAMDFIDRDLRVNGKEKHTPFRVIWITPMRALANDTAHSIHEAITALRLPWSVQLRTSDTSSHQRAKQKERLPTVLVTTPESLSVLLSYSDSETRMSSLQCAVVDEWHELLSTKRGTQTELGLARLRHWNPGLRTWGLSATLGNLEQAMHVLLGAKHDQGVLIHSEQEKKIAVETVLPDSVDRFPWAGHLGLKMLPKVIAAIESGGSTLVFANTRSFAEIWFRAIISAKPDWVGKVGIHHGSLDRNLRNKVEGLMRDGQLRAVVCTSSLDLGVDFTAVDQVIQLGSPKGIGRLMQRAGRSGHQPGRVSKVLCVPAHAFEMIEFSASREGIEKKKIESRVPLEKPLDVLCQHVVTISAGGGFDNQVLLEEIRTTHAYRKLTDEEWNWVMDFVVRGGPTLTAYPRFARVKQDDSGRYRIASDSLAKMHRLGIGTITGDGTMQVILSNRKKLGAIEEQFIARMRPGDTFVFAGRPLEFVKTYQMSAYVRPAKGRASVPSWQGGRFPLSTMLADAVRFRLDEARLGKFKDPEMKMIAPILEIQARWSRIPKIDEMLIESTTTRDGGHHFLFPFLGRLVHEGLGALIAYRLRKIHETPVTVTFTDYGIELLSPGQVEIDEPTWRTLLTPENLVEDLLACLNSGELTKRQFREISRVAGLIVPTTPGMPRSTRHLQASAELFFDVFREFDPENLLLTQARREVLEQQLEINRLKQALEHVNDRALLLVETRRLTPLAFPLWAQRISSQQLRMESGEDRIARMVKQLEMEANAEVFVAPKRRGCKRKVT